MDREGADAHWVVEGKCDGDEVDPKMCCVCVLGVDFCG